MDSQHPGADAPGSPLQHIGRHILHFSQIDSTNSYALQQADEPAHDGWVILADEQTAGRGQHGRTWTCPGGGGVLMSVILFPPPSLRRPAILTAWAAVSVCETIRELTGLQAKIKWPNDVLIQGRKVCGILIEQTRGTVVGIGLNVNQPAEHFHDAGLPEAASLAVLTSKQRDCRDVAAALMRVLDEEYQLLLSGDLMSLEACWKWRLGFLGKEVEATTAAGTVRGRLLEQTFDGVEIGTDHGTRRLAPEAIKALRQC